MADLDPRRPAVTTSSGPVSTASAAELLAAALGYAARGWPVFPCRPGRKDPVTAHGFRDASCDPATITAWWSRTPGANVAIATGAPGPDVLDVDLRPDGTGWPALARARRDGLLAGPVALVRTRNGGAHLYYTGTAQPCRSLRRHHLDLKRAGGYVLAPPSVVPADDWAPRGTGRYELVESYSGGGRLDWPAIVGLLDPPRAVPVPMSAPAPGTGIGGLVAWLARQGEGNRNAALFWAACRAMEQNLTDQLHQLIDAAAAIGLGEREAHRTIASARRRIGGPW
jgi:hypothetical protein